MQIASANFRNQLSEVIEQSDFLTLFKFKPPKLRNLLNSLSSRCPGKLVDSLDSVRLALISQTWNSKNQSIRLDSLSQLLARNVRRKIFSKPRRRLWRLLLRWTIRENSEHANFFFHQKSMKSDQFYSRGHLLRNLSEAGCLGWAFCDKTFSGCLLSSLEFDSLMRTVRRFSSIVSSIVLIRRFGFFKLNYPLALSNVQHRTACSKLTASWYNFQIKTHTYF